MSILEQNDPKPKRSVLDENDPKPGSKKPGPKSYTAGESFVTGVGNLKQGAADFVTTVKDAWHAPVDAAYNAATGTMDVAEAMKGMTAEKAWQALKNVGGVYKDRYTSWEGFKKDWAEHPYQILTDLATIATLPAGGGATVGGRAVAAVPPAARAAAATPALVKGAAQTLVAPTQMVNKVAAAGVNLAAKGRKTVEAIRHPMNAMVNRTFGEHLPGAQNALNAPRPIVPHSPLTTGQVVAQNVRSTRISAADLAARKRLDEAAQVVGDRQNAANLSHLRPIGRNPVENRAVFDRPQQTPELSRVERGREAGINYAVSNPVLSQMDAGLYTILNTPEGQEAFNLATQSARSRGIPVNHAPPGAPPEFSGEFLQLLKGHMDTLSSSKSSTFPSGAAAVDQASIRNNRNRLVEWINNNNPDWEHARNRFAGQSNIIDRQLISDDLQRTLSKPLTGDDTVTQRAAAYGNAIAGEENVARANSTISRATGDRRNNYLSDVLPADEMARVQDVNDNLGRLQLVDDLAAKGSIHADDINNIFGDTLGTHTIHAGTHLDKRRWVRQAVDDAVNALMNTEGRNVQLGDDFARLMLDPALGAEAVNSTVARNALMAQRDARWGLAGQVNRFINPVRVANRFPSLYNLPGYAQQQPSNTGR